MPPSVTRAQFPRATAEPLATAVPLGDTWLGTRRGTEVPLAAAAPIASLISSELEGRRFQSPAPSERLATSSSTSHPLGAGGCLATLPRLISQLLIHGSHINIVIIE